MKATIKGPHSAHDSIGLKSRRGAIAEIGSRELILWA